jgi:hypothetical protein
MLNDLWIRRSVLRDRAWIETIRGAGAGLGLGFSEMPEARHSMLLSDARQTSPLPANAPLLQQSVSTSNLDLRQVPRASEGRGHQIESSSNLGSGWHPWRRTGAVGRISGSRLEAPATVGWTASMKDLSTGSPTPDTYR